MSQVTVVEGSSAGWVVAFVLLTFIFAQRECKRMAAESSVGIHSESKTMDPVSGLETCRFQTDASRHNGQKVRLFVRVSESCKPGARQAFLQDPTDPNCQVLAYSDRPIPQNESIMTVEGIAELKHFSNGNFWVLTGAQFFSVSEN